MMTSKVLGNFTQINNALQQQLAPKMNSCRVALLAQMVLALCKVGTVTFHKLALAFESSAAPNSSMRRIQRFMANYKLDLALMAKITMNLIPVSGPYHLAIDRTDWEFGNTKINILMLGIVYDGCAFPILFTMLPKKGNSNTDERIALLNRFLELFGQHSIASLRADREFVGHKWMKYLETKNIDYYIRIRENFRIMHPCGKNPLAKNLFETLKVGQSATREKHVTVNGIKCYLTACRVKAKDGKTQLQIIVSSKKDKCLIETYKGRWQIETMFKALKTSGFNIEDTHLNQKDRLAKLLTIVMIAYTWAYKTGIYLHEKITKIAVKSHGRKAKSFVKYGLEFIASVLLNTASEPRIDVFEFLSCT